MMKNFCRWKVLNIVSDLYFEAEPFKIMVHNNFDVLLIYPRRVETFKLKGGNSVDVLKGLSIEKYESLWAIVCPMCCVLALCHRLCNNRYFDKSRASYAFWSVT
jgi:hypothetical protein